MVEGRFLGNPILQFYSFFGKPGGGGLEESGVGGNGEIYRQVTRIKNIKKQTSYLA